MNRRNFVKNGLTLAASIPLVHNLDLDAKKKKNIGIQIYTIRDIMSKDAMGGIKAIAAAGYKNIELAGYNGGKVYGMPVADFKKLTKDLGLKIPSSHVAANLGDYFKNKEIPADYLKSLDDAVFLGQTYQVFPFLAPAFRNDKDNAMRIADLFNKLGMEAQKRGLKFGYHNHAFEFDPIGDTTMMEIFMKETDPKLVTIELDLYWVAFANVDPVSFIKKYPGRFSLYHIKDMASTEKRESIEIGDGTIDFNRIVKEGGAVPYYLVEQEAYRTNSLEAMKANFGRIKNLKLM